MRGEIGLFPTNFITCPLPTPSTSTASEDERPPISSSQLKKSVIQSLLNPALNSPPDDWDVDQVEIWLIAIDFSCVATNFKGTFFFF